MPFPSLACTTCKLRHIRCDGIKPICNKCSKSGRRCHGMRSPDAPLSIVHSENAYASGMRKRPRGPRPYPTTSHPYQLTLPQQLSCDLRNTAMTYFLYHHVRHFSGTPSLAKSVDDDIVPIYLSYPHCPTIQLAISVISLVLFGKTQGSNQALIEASKNYHNLLQQTRVSLLQPGSDIERSLFVVYCMSRYEDAVTTSLPQKKSQRWFKSSSHHDGALAMISDYYHQDQHGRAIPSIVKYTRRSMIKSALLRDLELPQWIQDAAKFGEEGLDLEYDQMAVRLATLRQRYRSIRDNLRQNKLQTLDDMNEVSDTIREAESINSAIEKWTLQFPIAWMATAHFFSHESRGKYSRKQSAYTFKSLPITSIWLKVYATHILVLSTSISLHRIAASKTSTAVPQVTSVIQSQLSCIARDMLCTLPFVDDVGYANKANVQQFAIAPEAVRWIFWPLTLALCAEELDEHSKSTLRITFSSAGKIAGYGMFKELEEGQRVS